MPSKILELRRKVSGSFNNGDSLSYIRTNWSGIDGRPSVFPPAGHNHTISQITGLQIALNAKQDTITGGASSITSDDLVTNRALISDSAGKVIASGITSTELGRLSGVTSNIQTQLNGKAASSHNHTVANITGLSIALNGKADLSHDHTIADVTGLQTALNAKAASSHSHNYAGSSSAGGSANSLLNFTTTTTSDLGADVGTSGIGYISVPLLGQSDGALYTHVYSSSWKHQIYGDYRTGQIAIRGKKNGTWQGWRTVVDSSNIGSYETSHANVIIEGDARLTDSRPANNVKSWAIDGRGIIPSITDANNLLEVGFYHAINLTNAPTTGWYFYIINRHDSSWISQEAVSFGSGNTENRKYIRTKTSGGWTAWKEIADKDWVTANTRENTWTPSWSEVTSKPTWIGSSKPTYSYSEIGGLQDQLNDKAPLLHVQGWDTISGKPSFATVATSGSYADLSNKPTIPSIPSVMSASEGNLGTATTQRTINAANLKSIILNHSPAGSRPASDVQSWAKAASKPTYTYSDVGAAAASHTHTIANVTGLQSALNAKTVTTLNSGAANSVAYSVSGTTLTITIS